MTSPASCTGRALNSCPVLGLSTDADSSRSGAGFWRLWRAPSPPTWLSCCSLKPPTSKNAKLKGWFPAPVFKFKNQLFSASEGRVGRPVITRVVNIFVLDRLMAKWTVLRSPPEAFFEAAWGLFEQNRDKVEKFKLLQWDICHSWTRRTRSLASVWQE